MERLPQPDGSWENVPERWSAELFPEQDLPLAEALTRVNLVVSVIYALAKNEELLPKVAVIVMIPVAGEPLAAKGGVPDLGPAGYCLEERVDSVRHRFEGFRRAPEPFTLLVGVYGVTGEGGQEHRWHLEILLVVSQVLEQTYHAF